MRLIEIIFNLLYQLKLSLLFGSSRLFADAGESVEDDIISDYSIEKNKDNPPPPPPPPAGTGGHLTDTKVKIGEKEYTNVEASDYVKSLKDTDTVTYNNETLTKSQLAEKLNVKLDAAGTGGAPGAPDITAEVIIGGEKIPYADLVKKAEEHFKEVDFTKLDEERKLSYYESYTKLAHSEAWNKSYTRRDQRLADDKRDFKKEIESFETNSQNVLQSNLRLKVELEKKANVTDAEIESIEDSIKQNEAISSRALAKRDLQDLQDTITDNEKISKQTVNNIQREQLREAATTLRMDLESKFPELKTSEDIDIINKKMKQGLDVTKEDKMKLYIIKEVITSALRTGEDPEIIYEVSYKGKFNLTNNGGGGSAGAGSSQNEQAGKGYLPKDFHALSLKEQMRLLSKHIKDNPGQPGGIASDKTNSTENKTQNGQVLTEEQRSRALGSLGSGY